jgi:hypothetical protein
MRIHEKLKSFYCWFRSIISPCRDVQTHLQSLTKSTGEKIGLHHEVVHRLETQVKEMCQESGLILRED